MSDLKIDPFLTIETYSHFFKVTRFTSRIQGLLLKFSIKYTHHSFVQRQQGPNAAEPKTYAISTKDGQEFRFHIGQLAHFLEFLQFEHVQPEYIKTIEHELYKPTKLMVALRSGFNLYDYQTEAKDFVVDNDETDFHTRLVTIATGLGKGMISLASVAEIGQRILVVVLPKYTEKWAEEINEKLTIDKREIMIIEGSKNLRNLIMAAKEDKNCVPKATIISLPTLQSFYKQYEEDRNVYSDMGIIPEDLCKDLGIGSVVIDETHEHLHGVFRFMCYTHVPKIVALSGTVISDDSFIEKIHKILFPKEIRFDKIKMKKYIQVFPISYVFRDWLGSKIRTTEFGSRNYSQIAFEKSIMRRPDLLNNYFKLIFEIASIGYLSKYQKGDKLAIYAGSIAMCTAITEFMKQKLPHLDIRRYAEADPYENVIESDIRVTTIGSAGTAIDIPQLTTVIMTHNVNAPVPNLQSLGRLREIPGRDVKYFYMYSTEIQKHVDYHQRRKQLFEDRVAFIKEFKSPIAI